MPAHSKINNAMQRSVVVSVFLEEVSVSYTQRGRAQASHSSLCVPFLVVGERWVGLGGWPESLFLTQCHVW